MAQMKTLKLRKYQLLRKLPGSFGRKNDRKYQSYGAEYHFDRAMAACRGMVCIDLGANVGNYTCRLAEHSSRVIAFEPDPWSVARLKEVTAGMANVEIEEAAASVEDGEVTLFRHAAFNENPASSSLSSSIVSEKANKPTVASSKVRQVDFIRYLRELDCRVGILKIDIEGAEVPLLEKLIQNHDLLGRISFIFAETHEKKIPGHVERVEALREFARNTSSPVINLYWH